MVILVLAKKTHSDWAGLTQIEKQAKAKRTEKLADAEESVADPSTGLMKMMQRIYEEGDDEMKRTISKAWSESMNKRDNTFNGKSL